MLKEAGKRHGWPAFNIKHRTTSSTFQHCQDHKFNISTCQHVTQVAAGRAHTVLLRSDGTAVACGRNFDGQCTIPALEGELSYTQVAAGDEHTVLLRSDGTPRGPVLP